MFTGFGSDQDLNVKLAELLKNVPQEDIDAVMETMKANPEKFQTIQKNTTPEQAMQLLNSLSPEVVSQSFQDIKITG